MGWQKGSKEKIIGFCFIKEFISSKESTPYFMSMSGDLSKLKILLEITMFPIIPVNIFPIIMELIFRSLFLLMRAGPFMIFPLTYIYVRSFVRVNPTLFQSWFWIYGPFNFSLFPERVKRLLSMHRVISSFCNVFICTNIYSFFGFCAQEFV